MSTRSSSSFSSGDENGRRGAVAVLVAIVALLLIGFLGLSLDFAYLRSATQELQAAADAAALAAAQELEGDSPDTMFALTRQAAVDVALANSAATASVQLAHNYDNDPAGDVVVGTWDGSAGVFTPTTEGPDAVRVVARRTSGSLGGTVALFFGQIFDAPEAELARTATATMGGAAEAVILVLDPTRQGAFDMRGNARMEAPGGRLHIDSSHSCAMSMNGNPNTVRLSAAQISVVGGACIPNGATNPAPRTGADYEPDPLASVPQPDPSSMPIRGGITSGGTYQPGYYPQGINFNKSVANLNPGIYVLGPPGVNLQGSALVRGEDVMLFLALGAKLTISGNSAGMDLSAPDAGTYQGITVFQHRQNSLAAEVSGGGLFDLRGTMYLKAGHLEMDGNVDRRIGRIIVNTQLLRGNGRYIITGEGLPPATGAAPYLVE
jgi:Flp pilus assembly protein TadG